MTDLPPMKKSAKNPTKDAYRCLRALGWKTLWEREVPKFDLSGPEEQMANVALVRAVGVVFSESGDPDDRDGVLRWLRALLHDPSEKIRRYAMAALPKIGGGVSEESEMLSLLKSTTIEREKQFLARSLDKIGGAATIEVLKSSPELLPGRGLKVRANVLRASEPGHVDMTRPLHDFRGLKIRLRCRRGLEEILSSEAKDTARKLFRVASVAPGVVVLHPQSAFTLSDLYALRCFGTAGFVLGTARAQDPELAASLAQMIASPLSRTVFKSLTHGTPRYRLEFVGRGHLRGLVREVVTRADAMAPGILNDSRNALWSVDVLPDAPGTLSVELRPRLTPDPRFDYRRQDVPAASHPPLAASMARLAGPMDHPGSVWDPFCGSGLELIERAHMGGVDQVFGSDRSPEAIAIAERNFSASASACHAHFSCCDFRDFARTAELGRSSLAQIITNPPLGRRVPIPNLPGLIRDLFTTSEALLRPGGDLVFVNPVSVSPGSSLRLQSTRFVDIGGFDCRLQHYRKT